jgi:hypothetical protein
MIPRDVASMSKRVKNSIDLLLIHMDEVNNAMTVAIDDGLSGSNYAKVLITEGDAIFLALLKLVALDAAIDKSSDVMNATLRTIYSSIRLPTENGCK